MQKPSSIILSGPIARNTSVDEWDIKQIKKALNRLGYYVPLESIGITGIPDESVFKAIRQFQADHRLPITGNIRPDDNTLKALNSVAAKTPDGYYMWRTVEDGNVRKTHAQYNHTVRAWADAPDPGEDYGCRCWAEPVKEIVIPDNASQDVKDALEITKKKLNRFDKEKYYLAARLLRHYLGKKDTDIVLSTNIMDGVKLIEHAIKRNQERFEYSITKGEVDGKPSPIRDKILNLNDGQEITIEDYWDIDKGKFNKELFQSNEDRDFALAIGSVKIRSEATINAYRKGNKFIINGKVVHGFKDMYDLEDGSDNITNEELLGNERLLGQKGYAKEFTTYWEKLQTIKGTMIVGADGEIREPKLKWKYRPH